MLKERFCSFYETASGNVQAHTTGLVFKIKKLQTIVCIAVHLLIVNFDGQ
jgi:hypothetical protein